jgi:DNA-binding MarR family transcriptional regulator
VSEKAPQRQPESAETATHNSNPAATRPRDQVETKPRARHGNVPVGDPPAAPSPRPRRQAKPMTERTDEILRRHRFNTEIRDSLREPGIQLALLNRHVGARLELKDVDLDCLNHIDRHGPLSPSVLARRARRHPATMTGILDRLERGGWAARDREPSDRRAVLVRALQD